MTAAKSESSSRKDGSKMRKPAKPALTCRACGKEIVFLKTINGKNIPVDYNTYDNETVFNHKFHTSHFATCPAAKEFRKERGV